MDILLYLLVLTIVVFTSFILLIINIWKKYRIKGLVILVLSGLLLITFFKYGYLTKQGKIDVVVAHIVKESGQPRNQYYVDENGVKITNQEQVDTFKYKTVAEFYELNPNCCEIVDLVYLPISTEGGGIFYISNFSRLTAIVRVFYIYDYDKDFNNYPLYKENYYGVTKFGNVIPYEELNDMMTWIQNK